VFVNLIIVLMVIAMIGSLFSALWFMMKDRGQGTRTVKALSVRVSIWAALLALIGVGLYTGLIESGNSLRPRTSQQP